MKHTEAHWKIGDEVWARYFDLSRYDYIAKLLGHVIGVGAAGFTVRLERPDHLGKLIERHPHCALLWPSREAAEAHIAEHPFSVGPPAKK